MHVAPLFSGVPRGQGLGLQSARAPSVPSPVLPSTWRQGPPSPGSSRCTSWWEGPVELLGSSPAHRAKAEVKAKGKEASTAMGEEERHQRV